MNNYSSVRVGVAGATGYAGVELLRRLARHPGADVRFAMASSGSEARRVPALARIWDARGRAVRRRQARRARADAVFLAVPETLAAELAPALARSRRPRLRSLGCVPAARPGVRQRWYPHSPAVDVPLVYGLTERYRDAISRARGSSRAPAAIRPRRVLGAAAARRRRSRSSRAIIIDAKSGISGAGKTPTERTHFSECHGSISAYGVFAHRHAAEIEQELGMPVTFVPHLVPLDRGILETIYARLQPGVDEAAVGAALHAAYAHSPFVRLTGSGSAGDQARRAHELLRHRLAGRSAGRQLVMVVVHRQPGEGRGRPGDSELQRRVRLRRNDGAQLMHLTTTS